MMNIKCNLSRLKVVVLMKLIFQAVKWSSENKVNLNTILYLIMESSSPRNNVFVNIKFWLSMTRSLI